MRALWDTSERSGVRINGEHYQVSGAKRGPAPAHEIGIWIGAYKPRILRLTGRVGDGWMPSLSYLPGGPVALAEMNSHIDAGAAAASREPQAIRRMLNIGGQFTADGGGLLVGPPQQWADELSDLTLQYGISTFILMADDAGTMQLFAEEVAPRVREQAAAARSR